MRASEGAHPALRLFVCLMLLVAVQFVGPPALGACTLFLATRGAAIAKSWGRLILRARWLLLTLFLIFAFATPGEALFDTSWAPTDAGLEAGGLHLLRLLLMLGSLAWLFERTPLPALMAALWTLLAPLKSLGIDAERPVVRLALVLDLIQTPVPWRQWLDEPDSEENTGVSLPVFRWRLSDTLCLTASGILLALLVSLP